MPMTTHSGEAPVGLAVRTLNLYIRRTQKPSLHGANTKLQTTNHLSREVSRASTAMFSSATSKSTEMHMKKVIPD